MRVIVFFDLPTETLSEKKNYRHFRRFLLKNGYIMMQESVYSKLVLNSTAADAAVEHVRRNKPPEGLVQLLTITERQYAKIEFIVGEFSSEVISSDERLVIL